MEIISFNHLVSKFITLKSLSMQPSNRSGKRSSVAYFGGFDKGLISCIEYLINQHVAKLEARALETYYVLIMFLSISRDVFQKAFKQ